jgi:hypothetical protein
MAAEMTTVLNPKNEIKAQWRDPGDIFSLLLLVGADVVQKAIAQLAGVRCRILWYGPSMYLTRRSHSRSDGLDTLSQASQLC